MKLVLTHLGAFVLGLFVARYVLLRKWAKIEKRLKELQELVEKATGELLKNHDQIRFMFRDMLAFSRRLKEDTKADSISIELEDERLLFTIRRGAHIISRAVGTIQLDNVVDLEVIYRGILTAVLKELDTAPPRQRIECIGAELSQEPLLWIDSTPDSQYPIRILEAHLMNCRGKLFADPPSQLVDMMNRLQEERAVILEGALDTLRGKR